MNESDQCAAKLHGGEPQLWRARSGSAKWLDQGLCRHPVGRRRAEGAAERHQGFLMVSGRLSLAGRAGFTALGLALDVLESSAWPAPQYCLAPFAL
jgi:hypothetical protein